MTAVDQAQARFGEHVDRLIANHRALRRRQDPAVADILLRDLIEATLPPAALIDITAVAVGRLAALPQDGAE